MRHVVGVFLVSWSLLTSSQRFRLGAVAISRILLNLLDLAGIVLVAAAVSAFAGESPNSQPSFLHAFEAVGDPRILLLLATFAFVMKSVAGVFLARSTYALLAQVESEQSRSVANKIFLNGLSFSDRYGPAEMEWAILRSTEFAFVRILGQGAQFLSESFMVVFVGVLFLFTDWQVALAAFAFFILVASVFQRISLVIQGRSGAEFRNASSKVSQTVAQLSGSYREMYVGGMVEDFIDRMARFRDRVARATAVDLYLQAIPRLFIETALLVGALLFAFYLSFSGGEVTSLEDVAVFLVGSLRLMSSILPLQRAVVAIRYWAPQAKSAHEILLEARSLETSASPPSSQHRTGQIEGVEISIENACFNYGISSAGSVSRSILRNINLSISPGDRVAIIGKSGAGKSTLVDLILGLIQPSEGRISVNGQDPRLFVRENPGIFAYVPQEIGMIGGSIAENVALAYSLEPPERRRVEQCLRMAELGEFVKSLPAGIDSDVGKHLDGFSGGQLQRIAIARALYQNPKVLILDEATSALDSKTEDDVLRNLNLRTRAMTVITISHRESALATFTETYLLSRGRLTKNN